MKKEQRLRLASKVRLLGYQNDREKGTALKSTAGRQRRPQGLDEAWRYASSLEGAPRISEARTDRMGCPLANVSTCSAKLYAVVEWPQSSNRYKGLH